jgi:hypothetical protein
MAVDMLDHPTEPEVPQSARLLARLDLIAHAEEQAATAAEQARIAAELDHDTLACADVLTLAIEQLSRTHGEVCEGMAVTATEEGEVLLARALEALAASLKTAARHAGAAAIEAHDFGEALAAEQPAEKRFESS